MQKLRVLYAQLLDIEVLDMCYKENHMPLVEDKKQLQTSI